MGRRYIKLRRILKYQCNKRRRTFSCVCSVMFLVLAIYLIYDITVTSESRDPYVNRTMNMAYTRTGITTHGNTSLFANQNCMHPQLNLWNSDVKRYLHKTKPIVCHNDEEWVFTKDGKFYISDNAVKKHGEITCAYAGLVNKDDSVSIQKPIKPMQNGSDLESDAFKVSCHSASGSKYANIQACISKKHHKNKKVSAHQEERKNSHLNVLMFGFDSVSRHMFQRILPKSHNFFTQMLGGRILEGYNIVGDGTPQALLPILTGKSETEIPEVRRGRKGAKHVDEVVTFIWTKFHEEGYITQWGEDMANIGTFNLRMLGFKNQPVDHYMRPFYLAVIPFYNRFLPYCLGSRGRHKVFIDWVKEGLQTNKGHKLFTFGFFSEFSHHDNNMLAQADDDVVSFLRFLKDEGHLENTVLIVMSDHGIRYGSFRNTEQGKLEERMPYFGFRFPEWFKQRYPKHMKNFITNTKRLVTPFDIHETLLDILYFSKSSADIGSVSSRGISLFKEIPRERLCVHASIEPHWCACLQWTKTSLRDQNVLNAVKAVIDLINELLNPFNKLCYKLKLRKIIRAISFKTNEYVLKFKGSKDYDGRIPDLTDELKPSNVLYQITFETTPGLGLFEATVSRNVKTNSFTPNENEISRLNMYGKAADCIIDKAPKLRPYCLCKPSKQ